MAGEARRTVLPFILQCARFYSRRARLPRAAKAPPSEDDALLPTVALIGRPNVGKSALFNRLVRQRQALVYDTPSSHVTRDYKESTAQLGDLRFIAIDTSGLEPGRAGGGAGAAAAGGAGGGSLQGRAAALTLGVLRRSDAAIVMLDAKDGVIPADLELAQWLRRSLPPGGPPQLLLVANKTETREASRTLAEWSSEAAKMGLGEPVPISATAGEGMADLYQLLRPVVDAASERRRREAGAARGEVASATGRQQHEEQEESSGSSSCGGRSGGRSGSGSWADGSRHLSAAELEELAALREVEGLSPGDTGAYTGDAFSEDEGAEDEGPDLGDVAVDEDGRIYTLGDAAAGYTAVTGGSSSGSGSGSSGKEKGEAMPAGPLRVALVGAPNAGKSTLLNSLLGWERALTGPEPGLTRDANSAWAQWRGLPVEVIDTAGWVKKAAALAAHDDVGGAVAEMTQAAGRRAIAGVHVVVLLMDASSLSTSGLTMTKRDLAVATHAVENGKALVIVLSKSDLIPGGAEDLRAAVEAAVGARFTEAGRVPVLAVAALKGEGREEVMNAAVEAYVKWNRRVSTAQLLRSLQKHAARFSGSPAAAALSRVKWGSQLRSRPPTFVLFLRGGKEVGPQGERFLAGLIRRLFDLEGVPLRLHLRYNARDGRGSKPPSQEERRKEWQQRQRAARRARKGGDWSERQRWRRDMQSGAADGIDSSSSSSKSGVDRSKRQGQQQRWQQEEEGWGLEEGEEWEEGGGEVKDQQQRRRKERVIDEAAFSENVRRVLREGRQQEEEWEEGEEQGGRVRSSSGGSSSSGGGSSSKSRSSRKDGSNRKDTGSSSSAPPPDPREVRLRRLLRGREKNE